MGRLYTVLRNVGHVVIVRNIYEFTNCAQHKKKIKKNIVYTFT